MKIYTFDTTLRDGTQGESVSFSVDDKLLIAQKLDELGIDYIEGGWPGSNPKDKEFFERASRAESAARQADGVRLHALRAESRRRGPNVRELVEAGTPVVSIFGKSWDLHTKRALGITEEENLALISETVAYLKEHGKEVVYDAEHFFDGYTSNPDFALRTLEAAQEAGADVLCLCDTNGGTLPAVGSPKSSRKSCKPLRRRHRHPRAQRFRCRSRQHAGRGRSRAPRTCRAA